MTTTESSQKDVLAQNSLSEKDVPSSHSTINESNSGPLTQETEENTEYITGFKLFAVVGSVTLACFLLLLDLSILATVGPISPSFILLVLITTGCTSDHNEVPCSS